ncbi:MAG: hypothetical protein ABIA04_06715 [Pseudomonadota bacterium]
MKKFILIFISIMAIMVSGCGFLGLGGSEKTMTGYVSSDTFASAGVVAAAIPAAIPGVYKQVTIGKATKTVESYGFIMISWELLLSGSLNGISIDIISTDDLSSGKNLELSCTEGYNYQIIIGKKYTDGTVEIDVSLSDGGHTTFACTELDLGTIGYDSSTGNFYLVDNPGVLAGTVTTDSSIVFDLTGQWTVTVTDDSSSYLKYMASKSEDLVVDEEGTGIDEESEVMFYHNTDSNELIIVPGDGEQLSCNVYWFGSTDAGEYEGEIHCADNVPIPIPNCTFYNETILNVVMDSSAYTGEGWIRMAAFLDGDGCTEITTGRDDYSDYEWNAQIELEKTGDTELEYADLVGVGDEDISRQFAVSENDMWGYCYDASEGYGDESDDVSSVISTMGLNFPLTGPNANLDFAYDAETLTATLSYGDLDSLTADCEESSGYVYCYSDFNSISGTNYYSQWYTTSWIQGETGKWVTDGYIYIQPEGDWGYTFAAGDCYLSLYFTNNTYDYYSSGYGDSDLSYTVPELDTYSDFLTFPATFSGMNVSTYTYPESDNVCDPWTLSAVDNIELDFVDGSLNLYLYDGQDLLSTITDSDSFWDLDASYIYANDTDFNVWLSGNDGNGIVYEVSFYAHSGYQSINLYTYCNDSSDYASAYGWRDLYVGDDEGEDDTSTGTYSGNIYNDFCGLGYYSSSCVDTEEEIAWETSLTYDPGSDTLVVTINGEPYTLSGSYGYYYPDGWDDNPSVTAYVSRNYAEFHTVGSSDNTYSYDGQYFYVYYWYSGSEHEDYCSDAFYGYLSLQE